MLKCGLNEPNIQIKLILSQKYCMKEISVIRTFLGSGSFDPNIWVLLPFLDPNIGTLLQWKYIKDMVIMWLSWQTWLTQPGKFNLQATISILELWSKYQNEAGSKKDGSTPSLHPKFWCYIWGWKNGSSGPTFWGPMIDTILLMSFSGSNPDIWFKHESEPFNTIRPRCSMVLCVSVMLVWALTLLQHRSWRWKTIARGYLER